MEWDDRPLDARDPVTGRDGRDDGEAVRGTAVAVALGLMMLWTVVVTMLLVW